MVPTGFESGRGVDDSRVRRRIARVARDAGPPSRESLTYDVVQEHGHVPRRRVLVELIAVHEATVGVLRGGLAPEVSQEIGKLPPRLPRGHALAVPPRAPVAVAQVRVVHVSFVPSRHRRDG